VGSLPAGDLRRPDHRRAPPRDRAAPPE
jgi:hypothetical protein